MEHSASSTVLSSVGKWLDQRIGRLMGPPTSGPPSNTSNASDAGPPLPQGGPQMSPGGMQLLPGGPHSVGPSGTASPKVRDGAGAQMKAACIAAAGRGLLQSPASWGSGCWSSWTYKQWPGAGAVPCMGRRPLLGAVTLGTKPLAGRAAPQRWRGLACSTRHLAG